MPVTFRGKLSDGTLVDVTINPSRIMIEVRNRMRFIPLVNQPPMIVDLGLEATVLEIEAKILGSDNYLNFIGLLNPVKVVDTTVPEFELDSWWRFLEKRGDRRPGWVDIWQVRFRVQREYYQVGDW